MIILEYTYNVAQYILPKKCSIAAKVQLDFKYSDENGILVKGNPLLLITNTGINAIEPFMADVDMFSFDRGISKVATYAKERGRNNFLNYASQLQAIYARSKSTKLLK